MGTWKYGHVGTSTQEPQKNLNSPHSALYPDRSRGSLVPVGPGDLGPSLTMSNA